MVYLVNLSYTFIFFFLLLSCSLCRAWVSVSLDEEISLSSLVRLAELSVLSFVSSRSNFCVYMTVLCQDIPIFLVVYIDVCSSAVASVYVQHECLYYHNTNKIAR